DVLGMRGKTEGTSRQLMCELRHRSRLIGKMRMQVSEASLEQLSRQPERLIHIPLSLAAKSQIQRICSLAARARHKAGSKKTDRPPEKHVPAIVLPLNLPGVPLKRDTVRPCLRSEVPQICDSCLHVRHSGVHLRFCRLA